MKKWFILCFCIISIVHLEGSMKKIEVQGHRGARAIYPENTLPAFEYALKLGVDVLEMDVVVTKDNILVVNHDLYINGTFCVDSKGEKFKKNPNIRELNYSEVSQYDCGLLVDPKFPKQKSLPKTRIPRLEEVLEWLNKSDLPHAKKVRLNIETKIEPKLPALSPNPKEFVGLLIALLKKHKFLERSFIQSFDFRTLDEAFIQEPILKRVALIDGFMQDMLKIAKKHKVTTISPYYQLVSLSDVKKLHAQGIQVVPWTVNEPKDWEKMMSIGVDGIITDDPEALLNYLKNK